MHIEEFKRAVGKFPTGVSVITTSKDGNLYGFTASSFVSVSLAPPLVSFCLDKYANSFPAFEACEFFSVSILADDQENLAKHFSHRLEDKFIGVKHHILLKSNTPIVDNCASYLECRQYKKLECGDHFIFVGEVISTIVDETKSPLLYYAKSFKSIL